MMNKEISPDFYDIEYYLSMEMRYLSGAHQNKIDLLKGMLKNLKGKKVLDLGCGGGLFSHLAKEAGADVVGVDYSESAIRFAKDRYSNIDFRVANANTISEFNDAEFDAVLLIDVIEHVYDQDKTFDEINRVLKPDGVMVISTDLKDTAWVGPVWSKLIWRSYTLSQNGRAYRLIKKVEEPRRLRKNYHDSHVSVKSLKDLKSLLIQHKFTLVKSIIYPLVAVPLRDIFLRMLPLRYRGDHVILLAKKSS